MAVAVAVAVAGYNGMWGGDQDDQTQAPALSLSLSHVIRNHQHTSSDLRAYIHSSQQKKNTAKYNRCAARGGFIPYQQ